MWTRIIRYSQPAFVGLLGVALFFLPRISVYLALSLEQLLGVAIIIFAGVILYYDKILREAVEKPSLWEHANLAECIKRAFSPSPGR